MLPAPVRSRSLAALLLLVLRSALAAEGEVDPLALEAEVKPETAASASRLFVETALGGASQRYGQGHRSLSRASIDYRNGDLRFGERLRGTLSARLDSTDPPGRINGVVLSFREAYVRWQDQAATGVVEIGRINLREGSGYGYNPTDFFRGNALRAVTSQNPFSLREQRLGSFMVRGQQLWDGGSLTAAFAPKLASHPSDEGLNLDVGATNARNRGLLALGTKLSTRVNTQLLLYQEAGSPVRLGANVTALVSDAAVIHAEWSMSREPSLLERAGLAANTEKREQRFVLGATYTTAFDMSVTAEYQYNGFAIGSNEADRLRAAGIYAQIAYYSEALTQQDMASRSAFLLYAMQRNLGVKNLDLTAILRRNGSDRSRLLWLDLRYRMTRFDVALQLQHNAGRDGSEVGVAPIRSSASVVGAYYF